MGKHSKSAMGGKEVYASLVPTSMIAKRNCPVMKGIAPCPVKKLAGRTVRVQRDCFVPRGCVSLPPHTNARAGIVAALGAVL